MSQFRILVISDSFHTLPAAVETLEASGHKVSYIRDLISWSNLVSEEQAALRNADAIIMGRVLGIEADHFPWRRICESSLSIPQVPTT